MRVYKAPEVYDEHYPGALTSKTVFLAGSIEMGKAEMWQERVTSLLEDTGWVIFNPRRDDWDSSWKQSVDDPQFYEQVTWELSHLKKADRVIFYFAPDTMSPISLMELGIVSGFEASKCIVVCPEGFHRKGNVDVFCSVYGITQVDTLEEAVKLLQ